VTATAAAVVVAEVKVVAVTSVIPHNTVAEDLVLLVEF